MPDTYQLQEDEHIRSQQFCCISFIDPTPNYQLHDEECMHAFINDQLATQKSVLESISLDEIRADYRVYYSVHYNDLVKALPEKFHSATHSKGIKVRGVYSTMDEAKRRIAYLDNTMKNTEPIHIYLTENGKWTPFMSKDLSKDVMEDLNYTLYDYKQHITESKKAFNKRMEEVRREAADEKKQRSPETDEAESDEEYTPPVDTPDVYESSKDYLDEDKLVDNQRFCCVSFIEPSAEVSDFMYTMCIKSFVHSYLAKQYEDYHVLHEMEDPLPFPETLDSMYDTYKNFKKDCIDDNSVVLLPCFKVRGCFPSEKEASEQSEYLQKIDGSVDVYVGHVGFWLPFAAPNKDDINSVYNEKGLNEIHTTLNEHKRKIEENNNRMRDMNFNTENTSYGKKTIQSSLLKNIHPSEQESQVVEL
jgi:hypothetical protein